MANFSALTSTLKQLREEMFLDDIVRNALNKGALLWNKERERPPSGSFHISALGKCLRQTYYARFKPEPVGSSLAKKFRAGVDAGQRVADYLRRAERLFGLAVCRECEWRMESLGRVTSCQNCGSTELIYPEIGIRDLSISGSLSGKMDVLVIGPKQRLYVGEVKSASTNYKVEKRANVEAKLMPHIQQGNAYVGILRRYMRLLARGEDPKVLFYEDHSGLVVDGRALAELMDLTSFVLIYEDKNTMETYAHEFVYDHDMYLRDRKRVVQYFDYVARRVLPPREKIGCRYCYYRELCDVNKDVPDGENT